MERERALGTEESGQRHQPMIRVPQFNTRDPEELKIQRSSTKNAEVRNHGGIYRNTSTESRGNLEHTNRGDR